MQKIVEICCGSYYDAKEAYLGGASRIELNCGLYLGGLTPSIGTLNLIKENLDLCVISMVRPRGGGFCYTKEDFQVMLEDSKHLLENGTDGIAFGCLTQDKKIDSLKTSQMIEVIKNYNKEVVFHRAFDCVEDPFASIECLIELGVDRLLTSGLENQAIEGLDLIESLQKSFGHSIEILPGSGINANNAKRIMEKTGVSQVHSSCKTWVEDETTSGKKVSYSFADEPLQNSYDVVSKELVQKLIAGIGEY